MKSKRLWLAVPAVMIIMPVAMALAAAGKPPNKGAVYFGRTHSGISMSFEVSASGKSLLQFSSGVVGPLCNVGIGPPQYPARVKISHGRFTARKVTPPQSKNNETWTGTFTVRGGVKGTIRGAVECLLPPNFRSGPVKHFKTSWSADSEPAGPASRWCYDYVKPTGKYSGIDLTSIVTFHTPCKRVDETLHRGKFNQSPPPAFTSPGWTCKLTNKNQLDFSCAKGKDSFRFRRY